jgi:hypothetical protein
MSSSIIRANEDGNIPSKKSIDSDLTDVADTAAAKAGPAGPSRYIPSKSVALDGADDQPRTNIGNTKVC